MPVATRWLMTSKQLKEGDKTILQYPPNTAKNKTRMLIALCAPTSTWIKTSVTFHHSYSEFLDDYFSF